MENVLAAAHERSLVFRFNKTNAYCLRRIASERSCRLRVCVCVLCVCMYVCVLGVPILSSVFRIFRLATLWTRNMVWRGAGVQKLVPFTEAARGLYSFLPISNFKLEFFFCETRSRSMPSPRSNLLHNFYAALALAPTISLCLAFSSWRAPPGSQKLEKKGVDTSPSFVTRSNSR